jgi:para-nitrobenzyl esterase
MLHFAPITDGRVLPTDAAARLASGRYQDTPILTGLNQDEGSADPGYRPRTADAYVTGVRQRYGGMADRFLAVYPPTDFATSGPALGRDRGIASLLLWAQQRRQTSHYPIYGYLFTHVEPGPDSARFGAFHSSEIPYVFGTLDQAPERGFTALDQRVSERLQAYWVSYIKTGDPNGARRHHWPPLDQNLQILELGDSDSAHAALPPDRLALFGEFAAAGGRLSLF